MDYERCNIENDDIYLGKKSANFGSAVVDYFGSRQQNMKVQLPFPVQDYLTTYVTSCDSVWEVVGHTNIEVNGREISPDCVINVPGTASADATLVVDFGIDLDCSNGYNVTLDEGVLIVQGARIEFGTPFKIIDLIMSPCDDIVHIKKTYDDTIDVFITGGGGNDKIELGEVNKVFEDLIHSNIVINARKEGSNYEIDVHDESSSNSKVVEVVSNGIIGFHKFNNKTIAYTPYGIGSVILRLGEDTQPNIESTAKDVSLKIDSSSKGNVSSLSSYDTDLMKFSLASWPLL